MSIHKTIWDVEFSVLGHSGVIKVLSVTKEGAEEYVLKLPGSVFIDSLVKKQLRIIDSRKCPDQQSRWAGEVKDYSEETR